MPNIPDKTAPEFFLTVDYVCSLNPCHEWPRERIEEAFAGREKVRLSEALDDIRILHEDALWLFSVVLGDLGMTRQVYWYACWCAWQCARYTGDPRSITAIFVTQRFARGWATPEELSAARVAALAAPRNAAREAALAAGRNIMIAAWAAQDAVYWAFEKSRADQRAMMIRLVRRMERLGLLTQQQGSSR